MGNDTDKNVNELTDLLSGFSKEEAEAMIDEYRQIATPEGFKAFLKSRTEQKHEARKQPEQATLHAEYKLALAKARPNEVAFLKKQYRQKGLEIW